MSLPNDTVNIIIVSSYRDTYTNPMLLSLFKIAEEKNININFISPRPYYTDRIFKNIRHINFPVHLLVYFLLNPLSSFLFLSILSRYIKRKCKIKTSAILGIDKYGYIAASNLKKNNPFALLTYLSFEILFKHEIKSTLLKRIKNIEIFRFRSADALIIQDKVREKLFLNQMENFPANLIKYNIPVSPLQLERSFCEKTDFYENEIKIVYSGSIDVWARIEELIQIIDSEIWDKNFYLEFHSRYSKQNKYIKCIEKIGITKKHITLHNKPFDNYDSYSNYLSNFHIGLVLYKPNFKSSSGGENIKNIGLSSGKFATYLMNRIPVIVTYDETFENLNEKYNFGVVIKNIYELPDAIYKIKSNYTHYQSGAALCYSEVLNPRKSIELFLLNI